MRPNARACSLSKRGPVFASCPATELLSALVQSGGMVGAPPVHQRNGESVRSRGSRQLLFRFSEGLRIRFNKGVASREGRWYCGSLKERIELIVKLRTKHPLLTGLGLSVFMGSFFSALTGEVSPREESERLVRLTRLAAPFVDEGVIDLKSLGYEGKSPVIFPFPKNKLSGYRFSKRQIMQECS